MKKLLRFELQNIFGGKKLSDDACSASVSCPSGSSSTEAKCNGVSSCSSSGYCVNCGDGNICCTK